MCRNFLFYVFIFLFSKSFSQSLELMPGTERVFIDVQWLEPIDAKYKWTLFSRSRATAEYSEDATNLFTGAYLNYTTKSGFGGTILGRIATAGSGIEMGAHFFKSNKVLMIYALPTIALQSELSYSWFSILRFTPQINDRMNLYSSLELFSNFNVDGHSFSVQRIRLGLDVKAIQFGLAVNFTGLGKNYRNSDTNLGVFLRKIF